MNKKININPSSTKWLEKDDRVVADYFCDLGFRSLKQILDTASQELLSFLIVFGLHRKLHQFCFSQYNEDNHRGRRG